MKKIIAINFINAYDEGAFKTLTAHDFLWGYRDRIVSLDIGTGSTHFGLLMNVSTSSFNNFDIYAIYKFWALVYSLSIEIILTLLVLKSV